MINIKKELIRLLSKHTLLDGDVINTAANALAKRGVLVLPCKIGDDVWGIKTFRNNRKAPVKGEVYEIYFIDRTMDPCIVVKGVCRGKWGEKVFASEEDAEERIRLL